jgi:hypothetical protein
MDKQIYEVRLYNDNSDFPSFTYTGSIRGLIRYTKKLMNDTGATSAKMINHKHLSEAVIRADWKMKETDDLVFTRYIPNEV